MHTKKRNEQLMRQYATVGANVAAVGFTALGVAPASLGKAINMSLAEGPNWFLIAGGAATYGALKFAQSDLGKTINNTWREGVDKSVDSPRYVSYKRAILAGAAGDIVRDVMAQVSSVARPVGTPLPNVKAYDFFPESLNIVHFMAILGNDDSPAAQKLRSSEVFKHATIKQVFNNSRALMALLMPNVYNLRQFSDAVFNALGPQAKYLLTNYNDYNAGKAEWNLLYEATRDKTLKEMQEINFHHHCGKLVTETLIKSARGSLTSEGAMTLAGSLMKFQDVYDSYPVGSVLRNTAEFALMVGNELCKRADSPAQLRDLHRLPHLAFAGITPGMTIDKARFKALINDYKQEKMPWVKRAAPRPVNMVFYEKLMEQLVDKVRTHIEKAGLLTPAHYDHNGDTYREDTYFDLGIDSLDKADVKQAANHVVNAVQQQLAKSYFYGEHGYKAAIDAPVRRPKP